MKLIETNGSYVADSREVAEMVDREHKSLMRAIKGYIEVLRDERNLAPIEFFIESEYEDERGRKQPMYMLTRKGCDMVANKMTGSKGVLFTAAYVTEFERMQQQIAAPKFELTPEFVLQLGQQWQDERNKRLELEAAIQEQAPKVAFAEAIETSNKSVLIGELAKLMAQNGLDIGQNRLFENMRRDGYLIRKHGEQYNDPTQRSIEAGWFEVQRRTFKKPNGDVIITKTTKVTGKGQVYFFNKYKGAVTLV